MFFLYTKVSIPSFISFISDKDVYDDLGDYATGRFDFTQEHLDTVLEYFKTRKPELYEKYISGCC
jgi:hypothetical protein